MTPEQQQYYDDYLDLFRHPGWKRLVEGAEERLDALYQEPRGIGSLQALGAWQGRVEILESIRGLERATRLQLEQLESEVHDFESL